MPRNRGVGQRRKGVRHDTANQTPAKKRRRQVQQVSAENAKKRLHDTTEVENSITKMNEIASEAGVTAKKGLGYGAGEARIIIRAVINTIHARKGGLKWSTAKQQPQLQEVYDDMAGLFGMSHMVVRELFEDFIENKVITIKDESARGRGSVNAEPKRLRTNEQYAAIETFVDFCNSKAGGGKCTLEQIQKYMEEGPRLNSDDPQLDSGLRVHIPRSSLAYLLKKHLGYEFSYVNNNKTTNIMNTQKRHSRIRKFAIEMARALKLQEAGEFVMVFTDETYINTNHIPGTSWMHEGRKVGRPSGKGKRLVILHAISTTDFICEYTDSGMGIEEGRYGGDGGSLVKRNTAEWIWPAKETKGDYHGEMSGEAYEMWLEHRLVPAFEAKYPGKKLILVMDNASYHHEMNRNYYPAGLEISNCSKAWHAHVLRLARCRSIGVQRGQLTSFFDVPEEEPPGFQEHRELKTKVPQGKFEGTVYERKSRSGGISADELKDATIGWLKENKPEALQSKVELLFREKGWKIIWTPSHRTALNFSPLSSFGALGSSALLGGILGHGTWKRLAINLELASMGVSLEKETEKENIPRSTLQAAGRKRRGSSMLGSAKTARTLGFLAFQVT